MGKPAGGGWGWSPGISRLKSPLHRHERRGYGSRWAPTAGARRGRPLLPKATKLQRRIAIGLPRSAAWSECTRCWVCGEVSHDWFADGSFARRSTRTFATGSTSHHKLLYRQEMRGPFKPCFGLRGVVANPTQLAGSAEQRISLLRGHSHLRKFTQRSTISNPRPLCA
jgi:hypothetical protein